MNALYLMGLSMLAGYVIGKRKGKARQYTLLAIPVSIGLVFATYIVTAKLA